LLKRLGGTLREGAVVGSGLGKPGNDLCPKRTVRKNPENCIKKTWKKKIWERRWGPALWGRKKLVEKAAKKRKNQRAWGKMSERILERKSRWQKRTLWSKKSNFKKSPVKKRHAGTNKKKKSER